MKLDQLKSKIEIVKATRDSMEQDGITEIHDKIYGCRMALSDLKSVVEAADALIGLFKAAVRFEDYEKKGFSTVNETGLSPREQLREALKHAETVLADGK